MTSAAGSILASDFLIQEYQFRKEHTQDSW